MEATMETAKIALLCVITYAKLRLFQLVIDNMLLVSALLISLMLLANN